MNLPGAMNYSGQLAAGMVSWDRDRQGEPGLVGLTFGGRLRSNLQAPSTEPRPATPEVARAFVRRRLTCDLMPWGSILCTKNLLSAPAAGSFASLKIFSVNWEIKKKLV